MSFNTALSGLNAAQSELGVVSNNVANSSTVGFKGSRAEFADVYATSALGSSSTAIGAGVLLSTVAQQFKQGNLEFTQSTLDLAVSGEGFFIMHPNMNVQTAEFTRAGAFQVNSDGYVVNASGQYLQALPVNADGTVRSTSLSSTINLQLPQTAGSPSATTEVEIAANFQADASALDPAAFDPTQSTTYNSSTSLTVYDSLGNSHIATMYFVKDNGTTLAASEAETVATSVGFTTINAPRIVTDAAQIASDLDAGVAGGIFPQTLAELTSYIDGTGAIPVPPVTIPGAETASSAAQKIWDSYNGTNQWAVFTYVDDGSGTQQPYDMVGGVSDGTTLDTKDGSSRLYGLVNFDSSGNFSTESPSPMITEAISPTSGANVMTLTLDFANNSSTQFATPFNVTLLSQNGYTAGRLTGIDISDAGVVRANYSNGTQNALGKIALANFANPQGLRQLGNTSWEESLDSGNPLVGEAGTGSFGNIQAGALESSNVDLTAQLVKLITAQRNFQANAKAIETASAITTTVIQMR
ncbi:MAG: flagellar hook protein FlgE [Chromatiales bacterium]|nr:flagellar hook protein FlgE [Chromatiales bacterium]